MNQSAEIERIVREMRFNMNQIVGLKKALDDLVLGGGGVTQSYVDTQDGTTLTSAQNYAKDPSHVTQSASYRFVTDAEKGTWNGKQAALGFTPENVALKATDLSSDDDSHYPTVQAVNEGLAGVGGGGGGEVTAWWYYWLTVDDTSNAANYTCRQLVGPVVGTGNRVRVMLQGYTSDTCAVDNLSIGISNGTAGNTVSTPVELLFSGGHGCVIPAGNTCIWSDWAELTIADLNYLVVVFDYASSGATRRRYVASAYPCSLYFKASTNSYDQATLTGYSTSAGQLWHVKAINVKTV
jgi:hypothetical protein